MLLGEMTGKAGLSSHITAERKVLSTHLKPRKRKWQMQGQAEALRKNSLKNKHKTSIKGY